MTGDFPFMLSPVEAFLGLFSRIKSKPLRRRGSAHRTGPHRSDFARCCIS